MFWTLALRQNETSSLQYFMMWSSSFDKGQTSRLTLHWRSIVVFSQTVVSQKVIWLVTPSRNYYSYATWSSTVFSRLQLSYKIVQSGIQTIDVLLKKEILLNRRKPKINTQSFFNLKVKNEKFHYGVFWWKKKRYNLFCTTTLLSLQVFYPHDPRFLVDKDNAVSDFPEHF